MNITLSFIWYKLFEKNYIFKILDANNLDEAKKLRDELIDKNYPKNKFTHKIVWKFIISYFKKLTTHLENKNIPSTNNKIENIFQKVFSKTYKKNNENRTRTFKQIHSKIKSLEHKK